jgi:hypothetical protein
MKEAGAPVYNYYKPDTSLYEHTMAATRSRLSESDSRRCRPRGGRWTSSRQWSTPLRRGSTALP